MWKSPAQSTPTLVRGFRHEQQHVHPLGIPDRRRAAAGWAEAPRSRERPCCRSTNGSGPSIGKARRMPPAWSSRRDRSSEIVMAGEVRPFRWSSIWSAQVVDVDDGPAPPRRRRAGPACGPASCARRSRTSGFGRVSVTGRMRVPMPAAKTMAVGREEARHGQALSRAAGAAGAPARAACRSRTSRAARPGPDAPGPW